MAGYEDDTAAHAGPARVRPREVDVALVPDFALERDLGPAMRRTEGDLDARTQGKGLASLDEHAGIRDVSAHSTGHAAVPLEEDRERLVQPADRGGPLELRLYFVSRAGHARKLSGLAGRLHGRWAPTRRQESKRPLVARRYTAA